MVKFMDVDSVNVDVEPYFSTSWTTIVDTELKVTTSCWILADITAIYDLITPAIHDNTR